MVLLPPTHATCAPTNLCQQLLAEVVEPQRLRQAAAVEIIVLPSIAAQQQCTVHQQHSAQHISSTDAAQHGAQRQSPPGPPERWQWLVVGSRQPAGQAAATGAAPTGEHKQKSWAALVVPCQQQRRSRPCSSCRVPAAPPTCRTPPGPPCSRWPPRQGAQAREPLRPSVPQPPCACCHPRQRHRRCSLTATHGSCSRGRPGWLRRPRPRSLWGVQVGSGVRGALIHPACWPAAAQQQQQGGLARASAAGCGPAPTGPCRKEQTVAA